MKQMFRNIMALSLLLAYSLSMSISMQNFVIEVVSDNSQQHQLALNHSDAKTPELSVFPDLEPLADLANGTAPDFQTDKLKSHLTLFKYAENQTITKDNQYISHSIHIHPGLTMDALLYPFHTFS